MLNYLKESYEYSTKTRIDQAARLFDIPREYLNIDTHHPHVPPVFVVQMQIPSEPPPSLFTTVEDGPGWAILMFFKITEVTHKLINFSYYMQVNYFIIEMGYYSYRILYLN
jgi:hypothetical protein